MANTFSVFGRYRLWNAFSTFPYCLGGRVKNPDSVSEVLQICARCSVGERFALG